METPPLNRPSSRDRSISDCFTINPRAGNEGDLTFNGPSPRETVKKRSPATLPRAFEGMLKTTTETGDIGIFSIKPSRIPQSPSTPRRIRGSHNDNGLQKSGQTPQHLGVQYFDDRRRLPSYARDITSEALSMYQPASQKSACRFFDDADYRSYSMTQTSYSAYTLSNHRSYASLRSHQDINGLLQRPRSPFAYPTRLKRPGFRPSSPALTDGGVVDYSRRAEIDRTAYGGVRQTSSPSSLYTSKRKPLLSFRQEVNRSNPSLLSQLSPPRRCPSPGLLQNNGNLVSEGIHRIGSISGNTSPARSTFSLASTVNLHTTVAATSSTTTPGKLPPASPLYYDYTEDFEVDSYNRRVETLGLPPQFSIDKTILEERPMNAERSAMTGSKNLRLSNGVRDFSSPASSVPKLDEAALHHRTTLLYEQQLRRMQPPIDGAKPEYYPPVKEVNKEDEKKGFSFSSLGYGARELSTHVEEAFGLLSTTSFEISVSQNASEEIASGSANNTVVVDQFNENTTKKLMRTSSHELDTRPTRISSLPTLHAAVQYKPRKYTSTTSAKKQSTRGTLLDVQKSHDSIQLSQTSSPIIENHMSEEAGPGQLSAIVYSSQDRGYSSSGFKLSDTGVTGVTNLIKALEDSNRTTGSEKEQRVLTASERCPTFSQTIHSRSMLQNTHSGHNSMTSVSSSDQSSEKDNRLTTQAQPMKRNQPYSGSRMVEASPLGLDQQSDKLNFGHNVVMKEIPHSRPPMLAPKPISPARQLRLKNSVPQLMKALPPLPPEPPFQSILPPSRSEAPEDGLPCRFSLLLEEVNVTPAKETLHGLAIPAKEDVSKTLAEFGSVSNEATCPSIQAFPAQISLAASVPPPRLKLKMRSSADLRPRFSTNSRPRNREESYLWSTSDSTAQLLAVLQTEKPTAPKPPKFRLKITRASGSTYDTVRVNRESGVSNAAGGFNLRNHGDFFTSTAGIDNIFRQVSQQLHSRQASVTNNNGFESHPPSTSTLSPGSHITSVSPFPTMDFHTLGSQSSKPLPSTEAHSVFSDDSSHMQDQNSMKARLSNLRARIAVPYVNRTASQSYDDLTWRNRNRRGTATPMARRSVSNSHIRRKSTEARPLRRLAEKIHNYRLKKKLQGWLMEARSAITSRLKSRSDAQVGRFDAQV